MPAFPGLHDKEPLTNGSQGTDLVRILEASSQSLKAGGGQIVLHQLDAARSPASLGVAPFVRDVKEKNGKSHVPVGVIAEPHVA